MPDQDMFGMGSNEPDNDENVNDEYVLIQLLAADGWRAVFDDPTTGSTRILGLACFALVEFIPMLPDAPPARTIRPMVADENGEVGDVVSFEEFICLVPPGTELKPHVEYAIRKRNSNNSD